MSPLRRWMRTHGYPAWYSWLVVVLVPIMASVAVLIVSLRVNQQSIKREHAAFVQSQRAFCGIVILLDDTYRLKPPPPGSTTERLAQAVAYARAANNCPPHQGSMK